MASARVRNGRIHRQRFYRPSLLQKTRNVDNFQFHLRHGTGNCGITIVKDMSPGVFFRFPIPSVAAILCENLSFEVIKGSLVSQIEQKILELIYILKINEI